MPQENIYFPEETYSKLLESKKEEEKVSEYIKRVVEEEMEEADR